MAGVDALYAEDYPGLAQLLQCDSEQGAEPAYAGGLIASVAKIHYAVKERRVLDSERVMQRHDLECTTREGESFTIPACIFITVRGGKIVRIDEYLDSAQANALRAATGRAKL